MKKSAKSKRLTNAKHFILHTLGALLIALCPQQLLSQVDTSHFNISLPETVIQEPRASRTGYAIWKADSLPNPNSVSLTNRLFWENGLQLRQNAPGALATISARGAGPNRTAVLWNGLSLQSPMNGVVDASLLPLWPNDQLEVRQGGNSATQGSGSIGGSVVITTPMEGTQNGLHGKLGAEASSFSGKSLHGQLTCLSNKISSSWRAQWQSAENDFPFQKKGLDGRLYEVRQENNFAEKTDVQQFNRIAFNHKNILKTAVWVQQVFRQIPPATTEAASNTWQRDRSLRGIANWEHQRRPASTIQTKFSWQDEFIAFHYANGTERSRAQTAQLSSEWQGKAGTRTKWQLNASTQWTRAHSDGYISKQQWYQQIRSFGIAQAERLLGKASVVSATIRQEWIETQTAPFTWTIGAEVPLGAIGKARGHVSKNFNLPTFNDRFWKGLGNTELLPEKGYSADLGWIYKRQHVSVEVTGFYLDMDDWILWQPGTDGLFRPGNLRKVNSYGVETAARYKVVWGDVQINAQMHFEWTATENTAIYAGSEGQLGKQLPYTPRFTGGGSLRAKHGQLSAAYLQQTTGIRYTNSDNSSQLPRYQTATLLLSYDLAQHKCWQWSDTLHLALTVDNLWDKTYQSLANRPMPGRNWRVGMQVGW